MAKQIQFFDPQLVGQFQTHVTAVKEDINRTLQTFFETASRTRRSPTEINEALKDLRKNIRNLQQQFNQRMTTDFNAAEKKQQDRLNSTNIEEERKLEAIDPNAINNLLEITRDVETLNNVLNDAVERLTSFTKTQLSQNMQDSFLAQNSLESLAQNIGQLYKSIVVDSKLQADFLEANTQEFSDTITQLRDRFTQVSNLRNLRTSNEPSIVQVPYHDFVNPNGTLNAAALDHLKNTVGKDTYVYASFTDIRNSEEDRKALFLVSNKNLDRPQVRSLPVPPKFLMNFHEIPTATIESNEQPRILTTTEKIALKKFNIPVPSSNIDKFKKFFGRNNEAIRVLEQSIQQIDSQLGIQPDISQDARRANIEDSKSKQYSKEESATESRSPSPRESYDDDSLSPTSPRTERRSSLFTRFSFGSSSPSPTPETPNSTSTFKNILSKLPGRRAAITEEETKTEESNFKMKR